MGLAQLQPGDATQLVVGYTAAQGDHYLAVHSYTDGVLSTILEQQYQQYLVEDITGGGNQDLILMSTLEDGGVQIELLTVDKEGSFQQVAVMGDVYKRQFLLRSWAMQRRIPPATPMATCARSSLSTHLS